MSELVAIGVDGCRSGWLAVGLPEHNGREALIRHCATFSDVLDWRYGTGDRAVVAIDVPMGLTENGKPRNADTEARRLLGVRSSSVFAPPGRSLLDAVEYAEVQSRVAAARQDDPTVPGLSRQAFGLLPKIREVDDAVASLSGHEKWLIEVHPEVSFRQWAGRSPVGKRSAAGVAARLALVLDRFPELLAGENLIVLEDSCLGADFTDVLDAAAAVWSAERWISGNAAELGDGERDSLGRPMRIVA